MRVDDARAAVPLSSARAGHAVAAPPGQGHVVGVDDEAGGAPDLLRDPVERLARQVDDGAAVLALPVQVRAVAAVEQLVGGAAVGQVDVHDDAEPAQHVEGPVDRRPVHARLGLGDARDHLLRGRVLAEPREGVDDGAAGGGHALTPGTQGGGDLLDDLVDHTCERVTPRPGGGGGGPSRCCADVATALPSGTVPTRRALALALAPALALVACGGDDGGTDADASASSASSDGGGDTSGGPTVVTTVAPITSMTANVAGDRADVVGLVPEGTNSHTFEPPPSAAATLSDADVVFVNGLQLEEPTKELAEANLPEESRFVELGTEVLPESEYLFDFSFPADEGKPNPHLWTDPTYAMQYVEQIRDTLVEVDPDGAQTYESNAEAYLEKLDELDAALRADQESVPRDERELLTYHDAYAYFAQTYGWTVVGAVQPSDFEDPTPQEVARIVDQVEELDVPVVFGSEVFPSPVLEQIAAETGAEYVDDLRDDDLPGEPGEASHTFLELMRFNYVTMIESLGGEAPELTALDTSDVVTDGADYAT